MKLLVKFNLVLCLVFVVGFVAAGMISKSLLERNAQQEIFENARIMMKLPWPCAATPAKKSNRC